MRWEQQVQYASLSDIGFRRRNNQDSWAVQVCPEREMFEGHGHLFLVADGMGGHAVGELASKIAADTLPHTFFKRRDPTVAQALHHAIEVANAAIHERSTHNRDFERMGTTCSVLVLSPKGAVIGHVGDSRVYRVRGDRIDQLSFDHSLQWELLRQGKMKPEEIFLHEPRHIITRSLGPEPEVKIDIEGPYPVLPGDTFVLCSDGLTGHVNDAEIGTIARELPPAEACRLLVNLANLRGGSDNITVLVTRVGELPPGIEPVPYEELPGESSAMSWGWLAGLWVIAIAFVAGVFLMLTERLVAGVLTVGGTLIALVLLLAAWWNFRPRPGMLPESDSSETVLWRPYRSASASLSRSFLSHLASIEAELQHNAIEEGWSIDWSVHDAAYKAAKQAGMNAQYSKAFREYARAIDSLMIGVHQHRKQTQHDAKWKKGGNGEKAAPERTGRGS